MKYKPKSNVYSNSNKTNVFNPITMHAYSYNWWLYVAKINNKVVFNDYPYSKSTQKHQHEMRCLLNKLNIKIDTFVSIRQGLQGRLIEEALPELRRRQKELFDKMWNKKSGTYAQKDRQYRYSEISESIKFIERDYK